MHGKLGLNVRLILIFLTVLCCLSVSARANSCVWVAGTNNWSSAASWTTCGSVAPTSGDSCAVAGVGTLTVDGTAGSPNICGTTDFTGFTGTLTHTSGKELDIYGSLTIVSGMTYNPNSSAILKLKGTSGFTFATGGKNIPPMTVDGVSGTYTLQDTFTTTTGVGNSGITVTNGCFVTNNNTVTASLSSNNSNVRCLTLGTSTWNLNPDGVSGSWNIATSTNMTLSAASSTIALSDSAGSDTFAGGGLTYGTITSSSSATGRETIGNFTAATLTISTGAGAGGGYKLSGPITVTGTCTGNGNSVLNRDFISSDTKGTARTLSCGTSTFSKVDFQDITAAGAATWSLAAVTGGSGDCGGNTGITTTTPINAFMKTAVSVNWSAANWFTTDGGSTPISPQQFPLCQDTAKFTSNSVTAGSKIITIDASALRVSAMDWTGILNTPALAFTQAASYFGSITLVSGMTVSGTGSMTFEGRGSKTINSGTLTLTPTIILNAPGATWTQQAALTDSRTPTGFTGTSGTWAAGANNLTFSGASATYTVAGATVTGSGTFSMTGATAPNITVSSGDLNWASGTISNGNSGATWTLSGGTVEAGTATATNAVVTLSGSTVTLGTGGLVFGALTFGAAGSIVPAAGDKITSVGVTSIAVAASGAGGTSCNLGQTGNWKNLEDAAL